MGSIDRRMVVQRHNVVRTRFDPDAPLQVGNGEFALSIDVSGLQTLQDNLGTFSQWAWHTAANLENFRYEETLGEYDSRGRKVAYAHPRGAPTARVEAARHWYRANPHRLHLGRLGFELLKADGSSLAPGDFVGVTQVLDLWTGIVRSVYTLEGAAVEVITCVHPHQDLVGVKIKSALLGEGRLRVSWHFPAMTTDAARREAAADYTAVRDPEHATAMIAHTERRVELRRQLDADGHHVAVEWSEGARCTQMRLHRYALTAAPGADELSFVSAVAAVPLGPLPDFATTREATRAGWERFWNSGAAIDLSGSRDPRWRELERRVVLSQYLTGVQSCGSSPPQESGLNANSWFGKFHLEMTLWHGLHFILWGREQRLDGWMRWFREIGLPAARREASRQGYAGARWMKMIDARAAWESPSSIGVFRLTQQGHAIYWMEWLYRLDPTQATLEMYRDLVFDSAEFMADFVAWDDATGRYVLGPPLISGAEATDPATSFNSTVELSYWFLGVRTAQAWRERLGLPRSAKWDAVLARLSRPPVHEGVYIDVESHPGEWKLRPAWLEAFGCMPGTEIDPAVMRRTFERITADLRQWALWGNDFPMFALTATRLGCPGAAVDLLLADHEKNRWLENGFNTGGSVPYLPAHGGLLWAVAMMAAGWENGPGTPAPGFPRDGSWVVRWEGLRHAL